MVAHGYVRVSRDSQAESGLGIEAQRAAVETAAKRLGVEIATIHEDAGLSGSLGLEDRPGLLAAVDGLARGDVLLVAKRDRLGRDPIVVAMIERLVERKGARIVSAAGEGTSDDDPTSVLMRRIIDAFAEYERLLIRARTKAALRAKRRRGHRAGAVPYGFALAEDGRSLVAAPAEQEALALMRSRREAGASFREIADELNDRELPAKLGGRWYASSVRSALATAARAA